MKALLATGGLAGILLLAACGGGSSKPPSHPTTTTKSPGSGSNPAAKFSIANVSGVGNVVVDGKGRTVYILTNSSKKNVPCTDASGCTGAWPDLPFPEGTSAATAGSGINASLLGSMKLSDGETYPIEGDDVDLEPVIRDGVLLHLPLAPLCREDCAGPAPESFPALVVPDAPAEPPRDPRWAALDALHLEDDQESS